MLLFTTMYSKNDDCPISSLALANLFLIISGDSVFLPIILFSNSLNEGGIIKIETISSAFFFDL
ncbi:Uncharacterised protein [Chlamydia abortus]|nr:Uncharacterised protein [Chlamydia abortus]